MNKRITQEFFEAWKFLENHSYFEYFPFPEAKYKTTCFPYCLMIEVVKVSPKSNRIVNDEKKNTKVQVWIEAGDWDKEMQVTTHNIQLDCGGDTFEEAIIELASLVKKANQ